MSDKMATIKSLFILILVGLFLVSCKTNTSLNSNALIQKRRYTKGYHLNVKKVSKEKLKSGQREVQTEAMASLDQRIPLIENENPALKSGKTLGLSLSQQSDRADEDHTLDKSAKPDERIETSSKQINSQSDLSKMVEMEVKPNAPAAPASKLLIIILTILLPPLGVALVFGLAIQFWISLLLTLLFYIPGLIYSLIVVLAEY